MSKLGLGAVAGDRDRRLNLAAMQVRTRQSSDARFFNQKI
jgi:hypothetical protein